MADDEQDEPDVDLSHISRVVVTPAADPEWESAPMVEVAGSRVRWIHNPHCLICNHPDVSTINSYMLRLVPFTVARREYAESRGVELDVSSDSWRTHARNHIGIDAAAAQRLMEQRAQEVGIDLDSTESPIIDHHLALRLVQQKGVARILTGEIEPSMQDTLRASLGLAAISAREAEVEAISGDDVAQAFAEFWRVVRGATTPTVQREILDQIRSSKIIADLTRKASPPPEPPAGGELSVAG